jgi:signal transduction histidine kinase
MMVNEVDYHNSIIEDNIDTQIKLVENLVQVREKSIFKMYSTRLQNILDTDNVKQSIINNNREKISKILSKKYKFLRREKSDIQVFHFIDKNGYSYYRAHKPEKYGDYLADIRPFISKIKDTKKVYFGYEEGVFNISFRILRPIIYDGVYYGILEIGFKLDYVLEKIHNVFNNDLYMVLLNNEDLSNYNFKKELEQFNHKYLIYKKSKELENINFDLDTQRVVIGDKTYRVHSGSMTDSSSSSVRLVYFYDISSFVSKSKKRENMVLIKNIFLGTITIILFYFGFVYYENRLKRLQNDNQKKDAMLVQQNKLAIMGEMIAMIAHQWKQPLAGQRAILGGMILKQRLNKLTPQHMVENFAKLDSLITHMDKTISDFTNFFKPNKDKHKVCLQKTIDNSLDIILMTLKNNGITVNKNYIEDIEFDIYDGEFKQVILNILSNAKDALIENRIDNKVINIDILKDNQFITINISDNAGGIPTDIIEKIFEPYFSTKSKNGTGLGLYMSKIIVEEHMNGMLFVKNSEDGAVFTIKLPIS